MKKSDLRAVREVLAGKRRWAMIHGRCEEWMKRLPDGSVDSVIADPPYSNFVHAKQMRMMRGAGSKAPGTVATSQGHGLVGKMSLGFASLSDGLRAASALQIARLVRRFAVVFSDAEMCHRWREALTFSGMQHVREGAWIKLNAQPNLSGTIPAVGFEAIEISRGPVKKSWNGGGHPGIWFHAIATDRNQTGTRQHTAQKPLNLMLELVRDWTDPGELVLDPFAGVGTTGQACIQLGRRFIGIECDSRYASIAKARLANEVEGLVLKKEKFKQLDLEDAINAAKHKGGKTVTMKQVKSKKTNPFGVKVGEFWRAVDTGNVFEIYEVCAKDGYARVGAKGRRKETDGRKIRLDRFQPNSRGYVREKDVAMGANAAARTSPKAQAAIANALAPTVQLDIVVQGQSVKITALLQDPISKAVQAALNNTAHSGQLLDNWEIRTKSGDLIDPSTKVGSLNSIQLDRIFVNLKAGIGGDIHTVTTVDTTPTVETTPETRRSDSAIIDWKQETDGRFLAFMDALPGVQAYGSTREEAIEAASKLARDTITERKENGEAVPEIVEKWLDASTRQAATQQTA